MKGRVDQSMGIVTLIAEALAINPLSWWFFFPFFFFPNPAKMGSSAFEILFPLESKGLKLVAPESERSPCNSVISYRNTR